MQRAVAFQRRPPIDSKRVLHHQAEVVRRRENRDLRAEPIAQPRRGKPGADHQIQMPQTPLKRRKDRPRLGQVAKPVRGDGDEQPHHRRPLARPAPRTSHTSAPGRLATA